MGKKISAVFLTTIFLTLVILIAGKTVKANLDSEINLVKKQYDEAVAELNTQTGDLQKIIGQLESIKKRIVFMSEQIKEGEEALIYQKELLNQRVRSYYKNINNTTFSLVSILISDDLSESLRKFFYQKSLVDEDKTTIIKVVLYIKDLENQKTKLAQLKIQVDQQIKDLDVKISRTKKRIAELSAQQQQLIAQKLASLNIPKSAGTSAPACVDDRDKDPGFSPRLAFYTYGVPNRVGLNQYGAYGRAKAGQNEEEILRAYYDNFELKKDYDTGININVDGYGPFNIEEYVKRIYEVPDSWGNDGFNALKAQAIAARSYALAYTNNGSGSICATDQCQVFRSDPKGGNWERAVNDTKGWVMVQGGSPVKAWFSSTHGGYVFNSGEIGWSSTSWTKHSTDASGGIGGFSDLQNNAYDKDSPWFYCDWGSRSEYNKTAWLKPQEVADIVNAILLAKRDSSVGEHLYQVDKSNPAGTDTWDAEKVKSELRSRGGNPYNNISDVSVSADFGAGRVTSVNVSGDAGGTSIDAKEFKDWFNLRAPSNIQIVGPLFNIEKR